MYDSDRILEFIDRRFPVDCNWLTGNCYYFALILKDRFPGGKIYYDLVQGHFLYEDAGKFYDWSGIVQVNKDDVVDWHDYFWQDAIHYGRIVKDVTM